MFRRKIDLQQCSIIFFVEVGPNLAKKFKNNFEISSIPRNEKSLFLSKTDKLEVFNELKPLNNKKSLDTF